MLREQIYRVVKKAGPGDKLSKAYDIFIVIIAFISVIPLMFKKSSDLLNQIDLITVYILFFDYIFRWITYDYLSERPAPRAFIIYPFTPFAILDLASLLPSLGLLGQGWRILRLMRIFKVFHYSDSFTYIINAFKKEKRTLGSVVVLALAYIYISALAMFAYEPDTFDSFFEALYWATTALTTVGYGDVYPLSDVGKLISMLSSLFGVAVIALPAGIITASFVEEINKANEKLAQEGKAPADSDTSIVERVLDKEKEAAETPKQLPRPHEDQIKRYLIVMLLGVAMNLGFHALATRLGWPVWLDMTGTALAVLALEPAAGLIVGLADNFLLAVVDSNASSLLYYAVSAAVALIVGAYMCRNGRKLFSRILSTLVLAVLVSSVLSALLTLWRTGGVSDAVWEAYYYNIACAWGWPNALACFFGVFITKIYDILASAAVVAVFYAVLPQTLKSARGNLA